MTLQAQKLTQVDPGDVDDSACPGYRDLGSRTARNHYVEWHDETGQVFLVGKRVDCVHTRLAACDKASISGAR